MTGARRNALRAAIDNRVRLLVADAPDVPPDETKPCATGLGRCGSPGTYKRGCRGSACRRASADARAKSRKRARVSVHSAAGYKNGCRCDVCLEALNAYHRNYRRELRLKKSEPAGDFQPGSAPRQAHDTRSVTHGTTER